MKKLIKSVITIITAFLDVGVVIAVVLDLPEPVQSKKQLFSLIIKSPV